MDTVEPFGEGASNYDFSDQCFSPKWSKKISKDQAVAVYSRTLLYGRGSGPGCLKAD